MQKSKKRTHHGHKPILFILELCRPVVWCPLSSLAVAVRPPLRVVAPSAACSPCVVGRRLPSATTLPPTSSLRPPPPPALSCRSPRRPPTALAAANCRCRPTTSVLAHLCPPPALLLVVARPLPAPIRAVVRRTADAGANDVAPPSPSFLSPADDASADLPPSASCPPGTTSPLLSTVFSFELVGRAIRCGSIPHARPRGRRCFVRSSSQDDPPLEVIIDRLANSQADSDGDRRRLDDRRPPGGAADTRPLLLLATRQQDHHRPSWSLSVVSPLTRKTVTVVVVFEATPLTFVWRPSIAALLQHCASADNTTSPPPPANEVYCHCRLHVIVAAARAKERWIVAMWRHHRRAGSPSSPLDGALELPSLSAVKSANRKSN